MEADYVTVNPAVMPDRYNAVLMHWDDRQQEFVVGKISEPLKKVAADALAQSWAAACRVEVR